MSGYVYSTMHVMCICTVAARVIECHGGQAEAHAGHSIAIIQRDKKAAGSALSYSLYSLTHGTDSPPPLLVYI